jgi:iron complex outermembrane receptor protein
MRYAVVLVFACLVGPPVVHGEAVPVESTPEERNRDAPTETIQLLTEENVVTPSRQEHPLSRSPSNVYVITDEEIRQSGATDVPTLMRRVPGIEVMQTTGADFNVSVRGDNQLVANKLLVMVDGRSIYVDVSGLVYWKLIPVTLPEIKRIEVVKGPASAVYGFNAFDGVINIITKSPEEMKGTTVQFGGGELGTLTSAAVQAGRHGKFGYRLSLGEDQNQQWRNRGALAFRAYKVNVQTEYALPGQASLSVSGGMVDANRFDGPITQVTQSASRPSQSYVDVAYQRPTFWLRAWWNGYNNLNDNATNPLLNNLLQTSDRFLNPSVLSVSDTVNLEAQHIVELGPANRLTYGANARRNLYGSTNIAGYSHEDRMGLYLQDEWTFASTLTLIAGYRYDMDTFIEPTHSPRIALLYAPSPNHTFRLSGAAAYRPPNFTERLLDIRTTVNIPAPFGPLSATFSTIGNRGLKPEQIVSYEAEYQGWYLRHRLRLRASLFNNYLSDLISFRTTGPALTDPVTAFNSGKADIYGGEAGVEFLAARWLTVFGNYSYERLFQTFAGFSSRGAPRSKFNLGLRTDWDNGLNGEAAFHYVGSASYPLSSVFTDFAPLGVVAPDTRVGSYGLLNVRAGYRFWRDRAEAAVSAFNALNDQHREHPLGEVIGSRVMGWITVKY